MSDKPTLNGLGAAFRAAMKQGRAAQVESPANYSRVHRAVRTAMKRQYGFLFRSDPSFEEALSDILDAPVGVSPEKVDIARLGRPGGGLGLLVDKVREMSAEFLEAGRGVVFFRVEGSRMPWAAALGEPNWVAPGEWTIHVHTREGFPEMHLCPFSSFCRLYVYDWTAGRLVCDGLDIDEVMEGDSTLDDEGEWSCPD